MSGAESLGSERLERPATREHLGDFLAFIDGACARASLPDDVAFAVRLAAEEACTNVIDHGYDGQAAGSLTLGFAHDDARVVVTLEDQAPPFTPDDAPMPDLESAAEERALGGLGWHLIRQVMDDVRHEYRQDASGGGNVLTLVKHLSPAIPMQED